jgi:hypothetical protein
VLLLTMRSIYKLVIPFLLLVSAITANAQVYPVNGTSVLIPPHSVYLSDYTSGTTDRLVLNVVLNDVTRPELRVRLRMKIEGQNVKLETKPEYIGHEIVLQGGVPLRLSGTYLTEYFNPNALNFSGISRREFEKTSALPQGFYTFCFEVLEYNRGVKISNTICAPGWLILNDPPLVNLPRNNDKVQPMLPQNLVMQWTPRHTGSPNSAFGTEYEIKMVEVWPATRNPNDAILTSPPILETTTRSTTFIYSVAETPLELGRKYAFRIKAKSIVGAEELDLFKNNGYSEVVTFVYGDVCEVPDNIQIETAATKFNVKWLGKSNHSEYVFRYRAAGSETWYESKTAINEVNIYSLKPNTTYEYQIAGQCGVFAGQNTQIATVKTDDVGASSYSCGLPIENFNLDPAQLIDLLKVGDVIQAGDFEVKLVKVSGSNGSFSGEGVIEVPFFNRAKVKAEFTNIAINKEMRMVSGFLNVTGAGVEVIPSGVMDLMDDLSETLNQLDSAIKNIENNLPQPFDERSFVPDVTLNIPGPVIVNTEQDGTVVVTDANGVDHRLPAGQETAIVDDKGNATFIDSKGKDHPVSAAVAATAIKREYNLNLTFAEADNSRYGFDAKKLKELETKYDNLNGNYFVPFKSIETGKTDNVVATLEGAGLDKTKIRFESGGVPLTSTPFSGDKSIVTVQGKGDREEEGLIAVYPGVDANQKDQVLGRVNVVSYNVVNKILYLVPVNGNTYSFGSQQTLQNELNKIYGQAVVNWTVNIAQEIKINDISPFDVGSSGMLSNYTDHMKKVINEYKANIVENEDTYYLFLVSNASNVDVNGFMPRSKQAGFILKDGHSTEAAIARTMAHELGHGAFNLHHTFMEQGFIIPEKTTDNLMDYAGGTKLYKYQWDKIRCSAIVIGLFDSDAEGASKTLFDSKYVRLHDDLGIKAWASTKENDAFTKEIVIEVDTKLGELDKEEKKTYILVNYAWFDANNIGTFEEKVSKLTTKAKEKLAKELGISDFNLLVIVNTKYDTALSAGLRAVSFREWFFPMNGLDPSCTKAVKDYLNGDSKKKFTEGLNDALKDRALKLHEMLKECKIEKPKEIVIHYKRKGRNKYRTWGDFAIVGTDYKGYVLERPKGSDPTKLQDYKRHPAGIYNIDYSEKSGVSGKFKNVTLNLAVHPSYILHCGNRADQSDGCLLINNNSPQFDKYPDAYQSIEDDVNKPSEERTDNESRLRPVSNSYPDKYPDKDGSAHANPENPAFKLREKVKQLEDEIKTRCKCENVIKKIIIDESEEKEEL